ncbi:response regulator [Dethiobacter alkaliphilus]|uniref:response regulator n=1 Tax=Dethiobacter alkaliphilus TaxID=427926 RepID=UPI002226B6FD|nr:response regulator transcription factor [Dethiobacter alkaliphilus]MCW3489058.1 response regulator transcription factor [Dethiobacter alkaliphilus]
MKKSIKVMLVDDHSVVRQGLRLLLELDEAMEVCGEAETLTGAVAVCAETAPDVILLDFKLPDGDGIIGCGNLKRQFPQVKIIILTAYADDHLVTETIKAGADGYLLKNVESEELINTIQAVHKGQSVLDPSVTEILFDNIKSQQPKKEHNLTPKEVQILDMISVGKANKEIAEIMKISDKTVRNYVSNILQKLNVSNRTEAASYWMRNSDLE